MQTYIKPLTIRWSDLDPNFHLRHSVYYDFGAFARFAFLEEHGLTPAVMTKYKFGPILFREECVFRKEIRFGDTINIDVQLLKSRPDQSRWSIQHRITKNGDETAAILTVDGAWMDVVQRKLMAPPEEIKHVFENMPRSEQFVWDTPNT
jgi:acyl-CoA thioester hydrolase